MEFPKTTNKPMGVPELAAATGLHPNTIRGHIADGTLPAEKIGGQYIIAADVAAEYIRAHSLVAQGEAALAGLRARVQQTKPRPRKGTKKDA